MYSLLLYVSRDFRGMESNEAPGALGYGRSSGCPDSPAPYDEEVIPPRKGVRVPRPHPPEFRRRAIELARERAKLIADIASDIGISESCLRNWLHQADIDEGRKEGLSTEVPTLTDQSNRRQRRTPRP